MPIDPLKLDKIIANALLKSGSVVDLQLPPEGTDDELRYVAMRLRNLDNQSCNLNMARWTNLTDTGLEPIANIPLKELSLEGCVEIRGEGLKYLAGLRLNRLNLSGCTNLTDVGLKHLAGLPLNKLNLSNCKELTDAGLKHLVGMPLQELSLGGCRGITDAGLELLAAAHQDGHLRELRILRVDESRIHKVKDEVLQVLDASQIFSTVREGVAISLAKVVVLGEPGVGKTWLCERFFENFKPQGRHETHDFDLLDPDWELRVDGLPVRLKVWDFGGQHILHGTHEMFLDSTNVCLLLLDVTQTIDENHLGYWLKLINHFTESGTPVVIVVTKCDRPAIEQHLKTLDASNLQLTHGFPAHLQVIDQFSSKDPMEGNKKLRPAIEEALGQFEGLHAKVSPHLPKIMQQIERAIHGKSLVNISEFRKCCEAEGVECERDQDVHLRTLHNLGAVFYFGRLPFEDEQLDCREWVDSLPSGRRRILQAQRDSILNEWVINPSWLSWPLYAVLRASRDNVVQAAVDIERAVREITEVRRNLMWHDQGPAVVRAILELTELCFYSNGRYFFPRGLSPDGTPFLPDWAKPSYREAYEEADHAKLEWTFLAENVIHRLMVRWYSSIVDGKHWRYGMVVRDGNVDATIVADANEASLQVHIMGDSRYSRERLYEKIRHDLVHEFGAGGLVGKEPSKESRSWDVVTAPKRLLQTKDEVVEDGVQKLIKVLEIPRINIDVTPQIRHLLRTLFDETESLSSTEQISYRVDYFYRAIARRLVLDDKKPTYALMFEELESNRDLWKCFGPLSACPATSVAFEKAVRRAQEKMKNSGAEGTLNSLNPFIDNIPRSAGRYDQL